jgi:hypothetical protein
LIDNTGGEHNIEGSNYPRRAEEEVSVAKYRRDGETHWCSVSNHPR